MSILLEGGLPEELEGVPIYADFRNMVRFELILQDESLSDAEKARLGLDQLFNKLPPGGAEHAIGLLMWFYLGGKPPAGETAQAPARRTERAYDFEQDAGRIYAAFLQTYGINLATVEFLHWWEFLALLEGLPESTAMAQVMQWRTMDLSQIKDKGLKAHYAGLKKRFALASPAARERSVEEITRRNKQRVAQRFAEAEKHKKGPVPEHEAL